MLGGMFSFEVTQRDGKARVGRLATPHGEVRTPAFMPVGTAGSVKGVTPDQLRAAGARMILANTYHLLLRPGAEVVAQLGGVHAMMGWDGPILTDSGGYQVFSLADLRKIDDGGVVFQSHVDGAEIALSPERAIEAQWLLGADVIMQLDECPPGDAPKDAVAAAVRRSLDWARRGRDVWERTGRGRIRAVTAPAADSGGANPSGTVPAVADLDRFARGDANSGETVQALFGIQQGGVYADLRAQSAAGLAALDLPGYAIGGLSVGEGHEAMTAVLDEIDGQLPADRPRYLMGVGEPRDILAAVVRGVDLFDCVLPTRNGRNAQAFTWTGRMRLRNSCWTQDARPIDEGCDCYTCRRFSRGTLRHLFAAKEMLGPILVSIHNLRWFSQLMAAIREAIARGDLERKAHRWTAQMYADRQE